MLITPTLRPSLPWGGAQRARDTLEYAALWLREGV